MHCCTAARQRQEHSSDHTCVNVSHARWRVWACPPLDLANPGTALHLKISGHPIFVNLNFHMPLSWTSRILVIASGRERAGNQLCATPICYPCAGDKVEGSRLPSSNLGASSPGKGHLFDAEGTHSPRAYQLELFKEQPEW